MQRVGLSAWITVLACGGPVEPAPAELVPAPVPEVHVAPPWNLVQQDEDSIALRFADTPDGVRVTLRRDARGRVPGVTLVHAGETLEVRDGPDRWPLVAAGWPDRPLSAAVVEVEGWDVFVRLAGPPLDSVSSHPDAPDDPVLTWVRIRRRGEDWRIVVTGLATVSVPGSDVGVEVVGDEVRMDTAWGEFRWTTDAPAHDSATGARWWWTTRPSLGRFAPYPKTAITWTPGGIG